MERSTELQALTLGLYDRMSKGEVDLLLSHFTRQDGLLSIGTDAKEWWHGHETLRKIYAAQLGEIGQLTFTDCAPEAYAEGSVGWAADRPAMNFADGSKIPVRVTLVFHREGSAWRVVQMHWSVGISNEETLGKELTIE